MGAEMAGRASVRARVPAFIERQEVAPRRRVATSLPMALVALAVSAIAVGALATHRDVVAIVAVTCGAALARGRGRALEVGCGAAVVLAAGASSGTAILVVAAAGLAFATLLEEYAAAVFRGIVAAAAVGTELIGRPLVSVGLLRGAPPVVIAVFLASGRGPPVRGAAAGGAIAGRVWPTLARGRAIHRLDGSRGAAAPQAPRSGRARWRHLGDALAAARDDAFWGLCVARPLARLTLMGTAERRWLTPNRITAASIVVCFAAAALLLADDGAAATAIAIALIGVRSVLDSMDGQLARYRGASSLLGSFVDKVSDLFCWGALYGAVAARAHQTEPSVWSLLVPLGGAVLLAFQGVTMWLTREAAPPRSASVSPAGAVGVAAWARSLWRVVLFEEPDFYLWIALAVATGRYDLFMLVVAASYGIRCAFFSVRRAHAVLTSVQEGTT